MSEYKFSLEESVEKIGGSYQATGNIKARFLADDGTPRYVFRFDDPPGLLHIFNEKQLGGFKIEEEPKDFTENETEESTEEIKNNSGFFSKLVNLFGLWK